MSTVLILPNDTNKVKRFLLKIFLIAIVYNQYMHLPNLEILVAALSQWGHYYNIRLFDLEEAYGGIDTLYDRYRHDSYSLPPELCQKLKLAWQDENFLWVEDQIKKHAIRIISYRDEDYPESLQSIGDKPFQIYIQGDIRITQRTCLSCVGTRRHSVYGKRAVTQLLENLKDYPITLVSGMAIGIDGEVHRLALKVGLPTVAVLGGGLDLYEPLMHGPLGEEIAKKGCIISEYPPGVRPEKYHFLERNRIIAGLSRGTIVVEGKAVSGSLVTAKFALAYGREVGAVPGDIFSSSAQGPHLLLRDGAWPIISPQDVHALIGLPPFNSKTRPPWNSVHALLREKQQTLEAIQQALQLSLSEIQQQLTNLELEGIVALNRVGEYYLLNE